VVRVKVAMMVRACRDASRSAERAEPVHRSGNGYASPLALLLTGIADRPAERKEFAKTTASLSQDPDLDQPSLLPGSYWSLAPTS
jgi:hypothetical protein